MTSLNEQAREHATKPLVEYIKTAELSAAFTDRFNQFKKKLSNIKPEACTPPALTIAQGYNADIVFTDTSSVGFLFAPLRLFRPSYTDQQLFTFAENQNAKDKNEAAIKTFVEDALRSDPLLKTDICVSSALARETHQFTEVAILDHDSLGTAAQYIDITPRQTYLISRSGLNRIFLRSPKATQAYYASQFRATTFFPSRPYFWPAFGPNTVVTDPETMITTAQRASSFFHITQPYMDLGGNGIVITLSKGFRVPNITEFALCFDLAFEADAGLQTSLRRSVDRFDGHLTPVTCHLNDNSSTCLANNPGRSETPQDIELREALTKTLRDAVKEGQQDKVFGNILVLPPLLAQERQDIVLASIPVGRVSIDNADKSADFLVVEFDFFKYRRVTTVWALTAATCFFLSVSVLGFFLTRTIFRSREFEEALQRITFVMDEAPTPFIWLDHQDRVLYANGAFWDLTGQTKGTKFTLKSLITPETVRAYDNTQQHRTLGEPVTPYEVTIKRPDNTTIRVRIRSMDVPSLRPQRGTLPETFGVFLVLNEPAQAATA
jgi:PAS domain-containing protein